MYKIENLLKLCVLMDGKIIPTNQASPEMIAHCRACDLMVVLDDGTGLILVKKGYQYSSPKQSDGYIESPTPQTKVEAKMPAVKSPKEDPEREDDGDIFVGERAEDVATYREENASTYNDIFLEILGEGDKVIFTSIIGTKYRGTIKRNMWPYFYITDIVTYENDVPAKVKSATIHKSDIIVPL